MISVEKENPEVDQRLFSRPEVVTRDYFNRKYKEKHVYLMFSASQDFPSGKMNLIIISQRSLSTMSQTVFRFTKVCSILVGVFSLFIKHQLKQ